MAINFPTPATVGEIFTDPSGVVFTWNGYGWTQGGTAAPPAPVDAYTKTESDAKYVELVGDTMSGILEIATPIAYLKIDGASAVGIGFENNNVPRWTLETTNNLGLIRFDDTGTALGTALDIERATGNATFTGQLNVSGPSYSQIYLNGFNNSPCQLISRNDGLLRWALVMKDFESTGNLYFENYDDAGLILGRPLTINRATGNATFGGNLTVEKSYPEVIVNNIAGGPAGDFGFKKDGLYRWLLRDEPFADNFTIIRFDNTGAAITGAAPFAINRASGAASFNSSGTFNVKNNTAGIVASFTNDQVGANGCIAIGGMYVSYIGSVSGYPGMFKDAGVTGAFWYDTNNSFLNVAGGCRLSGDFRIDMVTPVIYLNDQGGAGNYIASRKNGLHRWEMALGSNAPESSGNVGSDFTLSRYDDAGAPLAVALEIARNDGDVGVYANLFLRTAGTTISVGPGSDWYPAIRMNFLGGGTQQGLLSAPAVDDATSMWCQNVAKSIVGGISQTATAVAFNVASAAEMKEDLKSFDAGNIIDDTKVYDFAWKSTGERAYGVVAQEAHAVYPQAVTHTLTDQKFEWWGVDYSKYVPVMIQEMKAMRARIRELEQAAGLKPPVVDPKARR